MGYRLLAVDMDGTLLNSKHCVSAKTRDAIRKAMQQGVIFTVSTGRPMQAVTFLEELFEQDIPLILYNGALVMMSVSKTIVLEQNLAAPIAEAIVQIGLELGVTVAVWKQNNLYLTSLSKAAKDYQSISGVPPIVTQDVDEIVCGGVTKVLWVDTVDRIADLQDTMKALLGKKVNCHTTRPMFLEFVSVKASKAIAMEAVSQKLGIPKDQMIAIGDAENDLPMIRYAGLGVAMGNAKESIKKQADAVTLTNDQDGVAQVIEQYILNPA